MKKIIILILSSLCSICCIAQKTQVITTPSFDNKDKILHFTFSNTLDEIVWIHQGYTVPEAWIYITFFNKDNKEIARRESAYSTDSIIILEPKETKKTQISLADFGYTDVFQVKIYYRIAYENTITRSRLTYDAGTVAFDWGDQ